METFEHGPDQRAADGPAERAPVVRRRRLVVAAVLSSVVALAAAAAVVRLSAPEEQAGPQHAFRGPLPDDAPLAEDSDRNSTAIAAQATYTPESTPVAGFYPPGYNTVIKMRDFSVPVYTVPEDHLTTRVTWVDGDRQPHVAGSAAGLQETWDAVPVPQDVGRQLQAEGTDGHLVIWQPSTDTAWEFWVFESATDDGRGPYTAMYGARIAEASRSTGVLPNNWGARATSLELEGGVMRMEDYREGRFPYALAVGLPVLDTTAVPPATRADGGKSATPSQSMQHALSEGMRFRLPADYACTREGLGPESTRLLEMMCVAVRDYGLLVVDETGGSVHLYAEDDRTVGTPYQELEVSPWDEVGEQFAGPEAVLQNFPWDDLQQVAPPQASR